MTSRVSLHTLLLPSSLRQTLHSTSWRYCVDVSAACIPRTSVFNSVYVACVMAQWVDENIALPWMNCLLTRCLTSTCGKRGGRSVRTMINNSLEGVLRKKNWGMCNPVRQHRMMIDNNANCIRNTVSCVYALVGWFMRFNVPKRLRLWEAP